MYFGGKIEEKELKCFYCLKWNGFVFVGRKYQRVVKTANYVAIIKTSGITKIFILEYLIYVENKHTVLFLGKELIRKKVFFCIERLELFSTYEYRTRKVEICGSYFFTN